MNNRQSLYLLWATILNQSQSAEKVLKNTFELFNRLNLLSNFDKEYKNINYEKLINLAIQYNCNTIKFNCVREDGRASQNKNNIVLSQDEYIEVVKSIEELRRKYESKIKIRAPLNIFGCDEDYEFIPELGFGCFAGKESICIDPLGNVKPCSHYPKEFICGNVKKDDLKYIWNNSFVLKQFREFKGNDTCNNCKEYNNCRGGCRYRCFKDGNINGIDPFCYLKNNLSC